MAKKKSLSVIWGLLFTIALIGLFVMGIQAVISGHNNMAKSSMARDMAADIETELISEVERQVEYLMSQPEQDILRHSDYLLITMLERKQYCQQQIVMIYQVRASTDYARSSFALAALGCIVGVIGWSRASRKKDTKAQMTEVQKKVQPKVTKVRKNIKKPK